MLARRNLLKGIAATPAAGLSLAAVLADARLSRAAAETLADVTITTADGREVTGYLALPETKPAGAVAVVHEWWGLNDQIKAFTAELANLGHVGLAVDLMGGQVATTPDAARAQIGAVEPEEGRATMAAWIDWLYAHEAVNGKVATLGFCFGGGWSLDGSLARPVDATVIYYGNVARSAEELALLKGPVLGHFATRDQSIDEAMVSGFEEAMAEAGKELTVHWYDAQHGFANPTSARYDQEDTRLAMQRTMEFLKANLE